MGNKTNIVLVGMPASGKSTIGVLVAKALSMAFIDTDLLIQAREGSRLQTLQEREGMEAFQALECQTISGLACERSVIATGGSAVYCDRSMRHLRFLGSVIFLDVSFGEIERRIGNLSARGVVRKPGMTLRDLYDERLPLYQKYADLRVICAQKTQQQLADVVAEYYRSTMLV